MNRVTREIATWGTEIYIEASSSKLDSAEINRIIAGVEAFLFDVDDELSTYKVNSSVSKLRQNKLKIEDAPEMVQEVWRGCVAARELTFGAFDPWAAEAGEFDVSGRHLGRRAGVFLMVRQHKSALDIDRDTLKRTRWGRLSLAHVVRCLL